MERSSPVFPIVEAWWVIPPPLPLPADLLRRTGSGFRAPETSSTSSSGWHGRDVDYFRASRRRDPRAGGRPAAVAFMEALRIPRARWEAVPRGDLAAAGLAGEGTAAFSMDLRKSTSKKKFPRPGGRKLSEVRDALLRFWKRLAEVPRGTLRPASSWSGLVQPSHRTRREGERARLHGPAAAGERPPGGEPRGREAARERFRYIFVDEFQDTDPLQAGVLRAIAADAAPGASSSSGIRSSRSTGSAVPTSRCTGSSGRGWSTPEREERPLSRNFRSRPDLLATLSGIFSRVLSGGEDFSPAYAHVVADRNDPGEGHPVSLYRLDPGVDEAEFLAALVGRIAGSVKVRSADGLGTPPPSVPGTFRRSSTAPTLGRSACRGIARPLAAAGDPPRRPLDAKGFFLRQEIQDLRMVLSPSMSRHLSRGTPP